MLKFDQIKEEAVGGKASSLARLTQLGFAVPPGFVILPHERENYKERLPDFLAELGEGPFAIRSSAMAEDGVENSFAGQFETFLNKKTSAGVIAAIEACFTSFQSERVQAYARDLAEKADLRLCVIVQKMVDAKVAGVLFTANPVNNRRDQILVNSVEGLGDKLVDGQVAAEEIFLHKFTDLLPQSKLLDEGQLKAMKSASLLLVEKFGLEIDAEWAIDQKGQLYWLQARPITTLTKAHFNELDTPLSREDEILTRGNVGEMMPGAITPLTFSTFGRAIEVGLQDFFICCGARKSFTKEWQYIKMHYNHLFISITGLYDLVEEVLMVKKENVEFNIVGHSLERSHPIKEKSTFRRLINQIKLIRYLNSGAKRLKQLEVINENTQVERLVDLKGQYQALCGQYDKLLLAYAHHYCTSSQSGSYYTTMTSIISGAAIPKPESHELAARLLVGIDGIAGKDTLDALQEIAEKIAKNPSIANGYTKLDKAELLAELQDKTNPHANLFAAFLEKHGHRCIREAELSEKDWSQDPLQIMPILQKQIEIVLAGNHNRGPRPKVDVEEVLQEMKGTKKAAVKYFLPKVRKAIADREYSKSLCIKIQQKLKLGYCHLANLLVDAGLLESSEKVFFLTHQEIGDLINQEGNTRFIHESSKLAKERQAQYAALNTLDFPDVSYGFPVPNESARSETGDLQGTIVSQGKVTGPVKIIRNLAEADRLEKGDIMVCRYTDIGWTPYFALISGLITEIGSPLSHGAVVAREYGIPAVVNVKGAMQLLEGVAEVTIDGAAGGVVVPKPQ